MYPISQSGKDLFLNDNRQTINILVSGVDDSITLTEQDIVQGSLSIDRASVSSNTIEIGNATASELKLTIENADGRFNSFNFMGAELFVSVGVINGTDSYSFPIGYFTVDNAPRMLSAITITALDRMVQFDKVHKFNAEDFPMTLGDMLRAMCSECNVTLATLVEDLINYEYEVTEMPIQDNLTYRQLLMWICQLNSVNAYFNYNGELVLEFYHETTDESISESDRYRSDIEEQNITLTGLEFTDNEKITYLVGTEDYALDISGNLLLQDNIDGVLQLAYGVISGFSYRPYTASILPYVWLMPMDKISFDKGNESIPTIVTNWNWKLNGACQINAKGTTEVTKGMARYNPVTKSEQVIINRIENAVNDALNGRDTTMLHLNEIIAGALGLYTTTKTDSNGASYYYYHSNPVLEDSQEGDVIYTFRSNGFAWCLTGWNDGNPFWQNGITKDGNAIFKFVYANGIEVANENVEYSARITPRAFEIWYRAMKVITMNADLTKLTKVKVNNYLDIGRIRIIPHTSNTLVKADMDNNIVQYPYYRPNTYTHNGVTFTVNTDGSITANGTATGNAQYSLSLRSTTATNALVLEKGKTYTLSGCPSGGGTTTHILSALYNRENNATKRNDDRGNGITFTVLDDYLGTNISLYVQIYSGQTVNNLTFKPMLSVGTEKYPYEPTAMLEQIGTDIVFLD